MDFTTLAIPLVKRLDGFVCEVSSLDRIWSVLFLDRAGKWRYLHVQQYKDSHYASLHRANQRAWAAEDVFDVLHYADLGRFKRRIAPFVTWEPLPILRPRE